MKSIVVTNPMLGLTAQKYMRDDRAFIGRRLFPLFVTAMQAAQYFVFDRENMLRVPTNIRRAPGTHYQRQVMKLSEDTFNCINYGIEELMPDEQRKIYASAIDADNTCVRRGVNTILLNHEVRVQAIANSNTIPGSNIGTGGTRWDQAGAAPIKDVDAAKEAINLQCGLEANVMVISRDVFNVLKELPSIVNKIVYVQKGVITPDLLAGIFGVEMILVAGGIIDGAADGQAVVASRIWGDNVILAHVENSQDLAAPNFGRTFAWGGMGAPGAEGAIVESYRDDTVKSDVHRADQYCAEKLVGAECGYRLIDVLT